MKKQYNRTRTNWFIRFNRSISNDFKGYAILLCIALIVPCLISIGSWLILRKDGWFHLYYVFGLNYPESTVEHPHKWLYLLIGIIGALVISGLMVTVFTNGVQRFVERIRNGRYYYKGLRNHYVLIGYNHLSISLIQHLLVDTDSEASLVILTKTDSSVLRAELQSSLDKNIEKRIIIYAADCNTQKQIENLNLQNAKEVYVTIDENERGNQYTRSMLILKEIALQTKERLQDTLLKVNVLINESVTYDMVQRMVLPQNYYCYDVSGIFQQNIDLHIFNFYENWARLLWSYNGQKKEDHKSYKYDSLDFEPIEKTDKYVHLVIIGFNSMGRALLLEALRICHYPNYQEETGYNKTRITIIDPAADILSLKFKSQIPYLNQIKDIDVEFCKAYIEDIPIRDNLASWAVDDKQMLTIAVCFSNPDMSMNIAMALPEVVFYQYDKVELSNNRGKNEVIKNNVRTRVLVRQAVMKSVEDIIIANHHRYSNLKVFGTFAEGMNTDLLDDSLAICINGIYCDDLWSSGQKANEETIRKFENDVEKRFKAWKAYWHKTSESSKLSSRYQVDHYRTLLPILARNHVFRDVDLANRLTETEHRRWIAERTLVGWRNVDASRNEKRVNELKLHTCIIPYSMLPEEERVKDLNVVVYASSLVNGLKKLKND